MSIFLSHLSSLTDSVGLVSLPVLRGLIVEGVVGVGRREEDLDAEEDGADLQRGRPLRLEHVQADAPQRVDVGVVDPRQEPRLGGAHRVVVGEEELQLEDAALVGRVLRPGELDVEVPVVVLVNSDLDPRSYLK